MKQFPEKPAVEWTKVCKKRPGEELVKNMAVAASLVLCAFALKNGALPPLNAATDAVVSAVTSDILTDDQLGKLSFVSSIFPEATLVFGQSDEDSLILPVFQGSISHAWNQQEPYLLLDSAQRDVYAAASGTVMDISHGPDEEKIIRVMSDAGLVCIYGNMDEVFPAAGDWIETGEMMGRLAVGKQCAFQVQKNGTAVNPVPLLSSVQ